MKTTSAIAVRRHCGALCLLAAAMLSPAAYAHDPAANVVIGAAAGAAIGGIVDGRDGALVGTAIGAAIGAAASIASTPVYIPSPMYGMPGYYAPVPMYVPPPVYYSYPAPVYRGYYNGPRRGWR